MCGSMADIQSATAEIRRGKKKIEEEEEEETTGWKLPSKLPSMVHRATIKRPIKQELTVCIIYLQCFDTVSLVAGRAPGLSNCLHYATIKTQLVFDLGNVYQQYDRRCTANCYFLSIVLLWSSAAFVYNMWYKTGFSIFCHWWQQLS